MVRLTGYLLLFCFWLQAIQGYISVLSKHPNNKTTWGRLEIKIVFMLKQWFRQTHARTINILFVILLYFHCLNVWMIVALMFWWLDYWIHSVEIESIDIITDPQHVIIRFRPMR